MGAIIVLARDGWTFARKHWPFISIIALSLLLAATVAGLVVTRATLATTRAQIASVLSAIGDVAGNPKLAWEDAAAQVREIGKARDAFHSTTIDLSSKITELADQTQRLVSASAAERKRFEVIKARRDSAIEKLETEALLPGERDDLARQLREAEDALDAAYNDGL